MKVTRSAAIGSLQYQAFHHRALQRAGLSGSYQQAASSQKEAAAPKTDTVQISLEAMSAYRNSLSGSL
ncbi:hypothetical protein [Paenibacillus sp. y28]|uniref:hypothetical protein n=1 Tax=Paenibacillus sp. y28 TaxID=3129110 RepID=UPI00301A0AB8